MQDEAGDDNKEASAPKSEEDKKEAPKTEEGQHWAHSNDKEYECGFSYI